MERTDGPESERDSNRRNFLRVAGGLGVAGMAGCLSGDDDSGSENGDDNGDDSEANGTENGGNGNGNGENGGDDGYEELEPPEDYEAFRATIADIVSSIQPVSASGPYNATESSLQGVDPVPEWFQDDKFGIYFHWGPYSVGEYYNEWYPRHMYDTNHQVYDYHVDNFGEPDEYPYQEFVPDFTAEEFDAEEWVELFEEAGARFIGPVAEHHDGWSNWESAITPWNASHMGPERDLTGELATAVKDRDLKFVTTFHHARLGLPWDYFNYEEIDQAGAVGHYSDAYENFPSVTEGWPDRVMYANMPTEVFIEMFLAKLIEVIDRYEPDLMWFDNAVESVPDDDIFLYLAHYYNWAEENDREVAVTRKQDDIPLSMSIEDFELGRSAQIEDQAWLTDTTLSQWSWSYVQGQQQKPLDEVIHVFIDIVSKNGSMLLNIAPRADGTIPDDQRELLLDVGEWLDAHGEAIYETRPWEEYGEGPNDLDGGGHFIEGNITYTAEDVRYTQSKDGETLYANVLGWPEVETITLETVVVNDASEGSVTLLNHGDVDFSVDGEDHLEISVPDLSPSERPSDIAVVFKIDGFDVSAQE